MDTIIFTYFSRCSNSKLLYIYREMYLDEAVPPAERLSSSEVFSKKWRPMTEQFLLCVSKIIKKKSHL